MCSWSCCTSIHTDTVGNERFRAMTAMYFRAAHAVVVGFDLTRRESLDECDSWVADVRARGVPGCVVAAVGNKSDLVDAREVLPWDARAHFGAFEPPVPYFETSARTGAGVDALFDAVARNALRQFPDVLTAPNENTSTEFAVPVESGECIVC